MPVAVKPTDAAVTELKAAGPEAVKATAEPSKVASTLKASEVDEPILQENPNRFVLFPLKYHGQ